MNGLEFAGQVLVIGGVGFDPAGAAIALAAVAAGARRRGLVALTIAYLTAIAVLGVAVTALIHAFAHSPVTEPLLALIRAHHVVGWGEIAIGVGVGIAAVVLVVRSRRARRLGRPEDPTPSRSERLVARLSDRLRSPVVLAGCGVAVALSLLPDPGFALLAVTAREQPTWQWVPAWIVWGAVSQILLLAILVAAAADRRGRLLDAVGRRIEVLVASSGPVVRLVMLAVAAGLVWDGVSRLGP